MLGITARGKGPVDAHFSIAMRHIHRYVLETESVVTRPTELCHELHYDAGVGNFSADLIDVHRNGSGLQCWSDFMAGSTLILDIIGRVSEVLYEKGRDSTFYARWFHYSGGSHILYLFGKGTSYLYGFAGSRSGCKKVHLGSDVGTASDDGRDCSSETGE